MIPSLNAEAKLVNEAKIRNYKKMLITDSNGFTDESLRHTIEAAYEYPNCLELRSIMYLCKGTKPK